MSNSPEIGSRTRTRAIMEKYGIRTKKSFGQNFLTDLNVLKNIVEAADITANDNVIEIGPGIGALTEQLAQAAGEVLALEIDQDLIPVLKEVLSPYDNVKVINQDVLQANLPELIKKEFKDPSRPIKVVANLPYYITSPILMNLLASPVEWATICVMMQKEVAQRLTAKPGTKQYGALTLAIEYQMQAKIAFDVSRKVFVPAPNVDSAIVVLTPRTNPLPVQPFDKQKLFGFIRGCFAHRRKSLWNNLQSLIGKDPVVKEKMTAVLTQLDISPQIRPEKLTLEQFIELANALHQQNFL
ncbi:16S rRNA (adenine(1518)-N(6)/adenine(1519)-N(6))-dimethyltransferase RsmA [Lactobacillus reuteri]|uniref:16S rRNA (adenine(1518)-N(6)/adenine(1519)-N(6))- dimethyltransferase RsmA n=1 Tax=Limosilactobacillus reuteri TaxID=1598 RepID=UPI00146C45C5|nr:16S rRNA (adenine(1518)-N(6)/adenine(1519)-N(6))-dimethyltransferase RsmA [Limosilactobacillus reuteri]NMV48181.1 16S rRNA (adenine(1518)-N(6)/adenine(1519)-N(6))-dimethyltransferase RsmA [Limosilactobacillus reuteri]NMV49942.1 16S rRNA (adenine(1518)-N(6)/adenine(1519)-N(6))-dimethyltransferase RsmA [Limosilactobacillus reuteri]NMV53597.1 16S rRNA (adenine(1518)-N(6)/adenine(1519)-N(6))-dimethyltransferase RsmA [Limosilactobacillus reuteri]NMV57269.1 16S rRNA (adenine(1518)-N(6)/adenine(151